MSSHWPGSIRVAALLATAITAVTACGPGGGPSEGPLGEDQAAALAEGVDTNPTAWWWYYGKSPAEVNSLLAQHGARLVSLQVESASPLTFTIAIVHNTASYGKAWWWYYGLTADQVSQHLAANHARLTKISAYQLHGRTYFAVVMIRNTGADAKAWWWYYGLNAGDIATYVNRNHARLVDMDAYDAPGGRRYAVVMISNSGADARAWWYYFGVTGPGVGQLLSQNAAFLINIEAGAAPGTYDVIMERESGFSWWWYYNVSADTLNDLVFENGARIFAVEHLPNGNFAAIMLGNSACQPTICDDTQCVNINDVAANLHNRLAGSVVGYSFAVETARCKRFGSGGQAHTAADAPAENFTPSSKMQMASVSKFVSALAAIRVLDKHSVDVDAAIGPYFPSGWTLGTGVAQITFHQLLTHTSGIHNYCNTANDDADLKGWFGQPVGAKTPDYSNCNFGILRVLLPMVDGFADNDPANQSAKLAAAYVKIVQQMVFEPVGRFGVMPKPATPSAQAYSYAFPGNNPGTQWGDFTLSAGAFGWYLSMVDIATVLDSLNRGDGRVLTPAEFLKMGQLGLGLDWRTTTDNNGHSYRYLQKNGGFGSGANSLSTTVALIGPGVAGSLFMNSDKVGPAPNDSANILRAAYMAALHPKP